MTLKKKINYNELLYIVSGHSKGAIFSMTFHKSYDGRIMCYYNVKEQEQEQEQP
jgi:hypothetical protein